MPQILLFATGRTLRFGECLLFALELSLFGFLCSALLSSFFSLETPSLSGAFGKPVPVVKAPTTVPQAEQPAPPPPAEAPAQPVAPEPEPEAPAAQGGGCDSNYDPCVPISSADLDCGDIGFSVVIIGGDPHGFDGNDNDGLGCESY